MIISESQHEEVPAQALLSPISQESEVQNNNPGDWVSNFTDSVFKRCYICKGSFVGLHLLTKHLRTHVEEVTCPQCSKRFPTGLSLHEHMRAGHFKDVSVNR